MYITPHTPHRRAIILAVCLGLFLAGAAAVPAGRASAQTPTVPEVNLNDEPNKGPFGAFQLVRCDGPAMPADKMAKYLDEFRQTTGREYVPCNFVGFMIQVQYLINVMTVLSVIAAIAGFVYAGYLYLTGVPGKITKAHDIFPKLLIGFVFVLTAWFIVYQILDWLTGNASAYLGG